MNITGKVESKSKKGTGIKVNGDWFNGTSQTLASVNWKDEISMEVDGKNITSISVTGTSSAPTPAASGRKDNVQAAIIFQSSRKDAVQVVAAALEANVLPMPTKQAEKYDSFMALVDQVTERYFKEAMEVQTTGEFPVREEA